MELVDVFDNKRQKVNKVIERYTNGPDEYAQAVHLWIENDRGEFLLQKRSMSKRINPGIWSITGGAVEAGEESVDTVIRECKEEIGLDISYDELELVLTIKRPYSFVDVYYVKKNVDLDEITIQKTELDEVKFMSKEQIQELMEQKQMGRSARIYFDVLCKLIDSEDEIWKEKDDVKR